LSLLLNNTIRIEPKDKQDNCPQDKNTGWEHIPVSVIFPSASVPPLRLHFSFFQHDLQSWTRKSSWNLPSATNQCARRKAENEKKV